MTSSTDADIKSLQAEIKELRADFASLTETLRDMVRHGGAEAAAKARESGEKLWNEAKKRASGVTEEIEENPVAAAAVAFGIGIILGMIFCGRRG
jgi:ElaB/YqjD/DUF883 family membrane-anchored ribosome-binding protein